VDVVAARAGPDVDGRVDVVAARAGPEAPPLFVHGPVPARRAGT
jgi:hypothetical protein